MASSHQAVTDLNANSSPALTDLAYIARDNGSGWFGDRRATLDTIDGFVDAVSTIEKTSDYTITASECDGR